MRWLNRLERKFGGLAIKNLMGYIVGLNALVFVLNLYDQTFELFSVLSLVPYRVLEGEVWRLVTFLFIPPTRSLIFIVFVLYFYFMIGTSLENYWGTFKFNFYYFLGALGTVAAAFITGAGVSPVYLNLSLFLAFATLNPNYTILVFFILPLKVKYLAYLSGAFLCFEFLTAPLAGKLAILVAVANYILFFGGDVFKRIKSVYRRHEYKSSVKQGQRETFHRCTVCGITEKDDPDMRFRYCTKCSGTYEYCSEHLQDHEHK